jgi:SnoaL-like domain
VLLGSLAGYLGSARQTVYGGVKAFTRIFAEGLCLDLRDHGVDVLELVLGVTRTPAMERAGLNFDTPGIVVAEPADVAREGLEWLGRGPVHVVSGNEATAAARSDPDRAGAVLALIAPCRGFCTWRGSGMTVEERLAVLEQRLRRAEDELAIARLMASYGPLADTGDADAVAALSAEDGEYDVDGWHMRSRADIAEMVRSPAH